MYRYAGRHGAPVRRRLLDHDRIAHAATHRSPSQLVSAICAADRRSWMSPAAPPGGRFLGPSPQGVLALPDGRVHRWVHYRCVVGLIIDRGPSSADGDHPSRKGGGGPQEEERAPAERAVQRGRSAWRRARRRGVRGCVRRASARRENEADGLLATARVKWEGTTPTPVPVAA